MATIAEIKAAITANIRNKTAVGSITRAIVADAIESVLDYIVQAVAGLLRADQTVPRASLPPLNVTVPFLTVSGAGTENEALNFNAAAFNALVDARYTALGNGTATNAAPVAANVTVTGTPQVGQTLAVTFTQTDAEGDAAGPPVLTWYRRSPDATGSGAGGYPLNGETASTYVLVADDENQQVRCGVAPTTTGGTSPGEIVFSDWTSPIAASAAVPPSATPTPLAVEPGAGSGNVTRTGSSLATTDGTNAGFGVFPLKLAANAIGYVQAKIVTAGTDTGVLLLDVDATATPYSSHQMFGIFGNGGAGLRIVYNSSVNYNFAITVPNNALMRLRGAVDTDSVHKIFFEYSTDNGTAWTFIAKEPSGGVDLYLKAQLATGTQVITEIATSGLTA